MPLDSYGLCPCGSGKKLKFCCHDLSAELEKIQRMTEGEQFQACLAHVDRLIAQHPRRTCLVAARASLLEALGRPAEAEAAYDELAQLQPDNSMALARKAEFLAERGHHREAVDSLQRALRDCDESIPIWVVEAIGTLAMVLASRGRAMSAIGHAALHLAMLHDDRETQELLLKLQAAPLPLVMKEPRSIQDMPGVKSPQADEGLALARRGAWAAALEELSPLTKKFGQSRELWQNLATLRSWVLDDAGAAEALRSFAVLDVPLEDAVEAEALAQLMTPLPEAEKIPLVAIEFPVHDATQLAANFAGETRLNAVEVERTRQQGAPPPQAVYHVLSRPVPASAADMKQPDDVPVVEGQLELYGKQTDREARLVLLAPRDEQLPATLDMIAQHGFGLLGPASEQQVVDPNYSFKGNMTLRWRLPDDAAPEQVRELSRLHHEQTYGQVWPKQSSWVLDGQTPAQAARDPKMKIAVLAMILGLEMAAESEPEPYDFNRIRQDLNLPTLDAIEFADGHVHDLPPVRFARVNVKTLSDKALEEMFYTAASLRADRAVEKLAHEVLERESLRGTDAPARACTTLANMALDPQSALDWIDRGRSLDKDRGKSCASWDFRELRMRAVLGDPAEFNRVLEHLTSAHAREPGVREAVMQFLVQIGAITPDGRPTRQRGGPTETESGLVVPETATAPAEIWTPESERPASGRSALWTPGSD